MLEQEKIDQLTTSAVNLGFNSHWTTHVLHKFGPDFVAAIIEGARQGLSVSTIVEVTEKCGHGTVQLLVDVLGSKRLMSARRGFTGEIIQGEIVTPSGDKFDESIVDVIIQKYLPVLIEKALPIILEKYGEQIIQAILDLLLRNFKK